VALPSTATAGLCPRCLMAEAMVPTQADADPAAARQTLAPEELAPFFPQLEILECLGRGGMGVVYKARQKSLNRFVALKLLAPERVRDAQFAERFTREAQALAALSHPNIVTIYDFGQAGGFYFLLMEFVDGVNLRQLLRARKFTPEEALAIVPPLCDALQLAHDRGIVHRDIKPENLLLDKDGRVKVADFGIAKMLGAVDAAGKGSGASAPENATQTAVGTPSYSAPEQKTDPQRVDSRADIYSLGVVFYEMLTGELPGKRIEPPSHKVQIDVRLDEVVLRALEQNPVLRYQQVSEVKTMVETIVATNPKPMAPSAHSQPSTQTMNLNTNKSFWRGLVVSVIVAVCLVVGLAILFLLKEKPIQGPNSTKLNQPSTFTPAAGPVELKLKWPPVGERLVVDIETKRNGEYLNPGQPAPQKEELTLEKKFGLTVLKATPGGGHEVELEFLSRRERIALGGKRVVDYDSTEKSSALGPNSLADLYGKVVGSKIRYFLNASNEVERMEGVDELEQRLSSGASADTSAFSRIQFSEGYLKQMMNGLHCFLPPKAVQPGDTWPFQMEIAMSPLGTVNMDYTVTFQNWEQHWKRNCARLEFQSTVKTKPDPNSNPAGTSVSSFEGTISGVAWFDPEPGMIIETAANNDMKMVINMPINPSGNLGASGPTQSTIYQWHDVANTTVLQHFVLEAPDAAIAGIGVTLGVDGENIVVQEIVPGLPAAAQKDIHVGDRIIAVAQDTGLTVPVQGGKFTQAVDLIHGLAGTTVRLTLVSSGEDDSHARVVSFVRAELKAPLR
jgi:serine/threonine protein kinase